MSRRGIALGAAAATVGLSLAGAWVGVNGAVAPADPVPARAPLLRVSVVTAEQSSMAEEIRVTGTVVPREHVVVVPELAGLRVREVFAETGDRVRKGQRLAELDGESLHIQGEALRTEYERTREEYERMRELQSSGIVSREMLRQRQSAFEVAQARWRDTQLSVQRTQIVAPANGLIYERMATVGGLADGNQPLFRIARDGEVEMEASVPESLVPRLRPGMAVAVTVAGEGATVPGTVRLIRPVVDATSRAAAVRIAFVRPRGAPVGASVGVFCEAAITVDAVGGWVVPGTALQQDAQGPYVWQVGPAQQVARTPVSVVARTAQRVVLGASPGPLPIVARAGSFLHDGDLVAIATP